MTVIMLAFLTGCRPPRVVPLPGTPVSTKLLPIGGNLVGHQKILFTWELRDGEMLTHGEGVARIAAPDSVRLDFFLGGGFGAGAVIMVGDSVHLPGADVIRQLVPPRALLWAALGRLQLPAERDTVVRVDGTAIRADIGAPIHWRATFQQDTLSRLERIEKGRMLEWVERAAQGSVKYKNESTRRTLSLVIQHADVVPSFDPSIWSL